ncbi:MAG: UDP-N-acetylmuramoyl-L-alanyl-D-glutamate--2,6-diaminopimelate ligase [Holosporales bacterium]|nr:UDP-N-acetylmuramoyl-L-alanyl-D-glutamate--2,6-diaminopimelate ligase [Holosporales bacterium]
MNNVRISSKLVVKSDIFIGVFCEKIREHVMEAKHNGAIMIFADKESELILGDAGRDVIFVDDARLLISRMAKFTHSLQPECCVAITGTNGKSSIAHFVRQLWNKLGKRAANLGTLGLFIENGTRIESESLGIPSLTTPDSFSLHRILEFLVDRNISHFAFEASSHALHQKRLHSVTLSAAAFSNLSSDHLDYHVTKAAYLEAKLLLFKEILGQDNPAIIPSIPIDMMQRIQEFNRNIMTFGIEDAANISGTNIRCNYDRTIFDLSIDGESYRNIEVKLYGEFQIMNLICAIGLVYACGASPGEIVNALPYITGLSGRMELILDKNGKRVYIDYAHTSSAFEASLNALKKSCQNRLICVFGCGGDRDKSKRREMGEIAYEISDIAIITDDNPRTEDPSVIRAEILRSCQKGIEIGDRKAAIRYTIDMMLPGDIVAIMGKGHETNQIIMNGTIYHDDREEILKCEEYL